MTILDGAESTPSRLLDIGSQNLTQVYRKYGDCRENGCGKTAIAIALLNSELTEIG